MGQIKNIKLHIVTDIKGNREGTRGIMWMASTLSIVVWNKGK